MTIGVKTLPRVITPARALKVQAQSASLVVPAEVLVDSAASATATLAPARPGRTVTLQRQAGTGWTAEDTGLESADGTVTFGLDTSVAGQQTYRVVAAAAKGAASVASAARTLVVKAGPTIDTTPPDDSRDSKRDSGRLDESTDQLLAIRQGADTTWGNHVTHEDYAAAAGQTASPA